MRHEVFVIILLWLAVQIPLGVLVAGYLRAGSTDPRRNAPSRIKRARIRRNHAALAPSGQSTRKILAFR
jgi:hypothetical protein